VLGKHAGRAGVEAALDEHDVDVDDEELTTLVERVKRLGERGHRVNDADLLALADEVRGGDGERERRVVLEDLTVTCGDGAPAAAVELTVDGQRRVGAATGAGPVDAAVSTVREAVGDESIHLEDYRADAVTGGTDAVVRVEMELRRGDRSVLVGDGDVDVVLASVRAAVDGLNRLLPATDDPTDGSRVGADD